MSGTLPSATCRGIVAITSFDARSAILVSISIPRAYSKTSRMDILYSSRPMDIDTASDLSSSLQLLPRPDKHISATESWYKSRKGSMLPGGIAWTASLARQVAAFAVERFMAFASVLGGGWLLRYLRLAVPGLRGCCSRMVEGALG